MEWNGSQGQCQRLTPIPAALRAFSQCKSHLPRRHDAYDWCGCHCAYVCVCVCVCGLAAADAANVICAALWGTGLDFDWWWTLHTSCSCSWGSFKPMGQLYRVKDSADSTHRSSFSLCGIQSSFSICQQIENICSTAFWTMCCDKLKQTQP